MAKLIKVSEVHNLIADRSSMTDKIRDFLMPHVQYETMMLGDLFTSYDDNAAIAIDLSGTTDKKSKAYKAAIRTVQLWKQGKGKPGKVNQGKVIRALDKQGELLPYLSDAATSIHETVKVSFTAVVTISQITEQRTIHAELSGDELQDFLQTGLESNIEGYHAIANAGHFPPLAAVYSPVHITIG